MTAHLTGGLKRLPGSPKVRLWDRVMEFLRTLTKLTEPMWSPDNILYHRAQHPAWVRGQVMGSDGVKAAWATMVQEVYANMDMVLPMDAVRSRVRDLFLAAWVSFTNRNHLSSHGLTTMSGQTLGFAATIRMPKEKDTTGRAGRRSKKSGGVVSRANLARGRTLLTFKLPNMITDTCGIELVWCSDHLEVARVGAAAAEVGWVGECGGSQVICADDVLVKVNGVEVIADDIESATTFLEAQRHVCPVTIVVERNMNKQYTVGHGVTIDHDFWRVEPEAGPKRRVLQWIADEDEGEEDVDGLQRLLTGSRSRHRRAAQGADEGEEEGEEDDDEDDEEGCGGGSSSGRGTKRGRGPAEEGRRQRRRHDDGEERTRPQTRGRPTGRVKYGDMYTVVVGRSHYPGGRPARRDPVSLIRDKSEEMEKLHAMSAVKAEAHGRVLGYVAEDYHLNLLAYLLDNASTYQCDAEVDNTQGTVNDDDLMDIKITVSLT